MLFTISPHPAGDSTSLMDDSQVIAEFLKTKDPDLFETLVDRHKDKVFRLALSICDQVLSVLASSTSSSFGFCASSMPISSHCFWP